MKAPTRLAIFGDPALNRVADFAAAARAQGVDVVTIPWRAVFASRLGFRPLWRDRLVKLESPGFEVPVERGFRLRGGAAGVVPDSVIGEIASGTGRLAATTAWFAGFAQTLAFLAEIGAEDRVRFVNAPADVAAMFDKVACHARLAAAGVPVPPALPPPRSCDDLLAAMRAARMPRVFLKPAHGSGGGGVVAFETQGDRWRAATALAWEFAAGAGPKLYTTSRLRTETDLAVLRPVLDALCAERLHVEAWMPKAGLEGRTFDVRVVVIGGRALPPVLRLGRGPITNLHLGAEKAGAELLERRAGRACVDRLRAVAEQTMRVFPQSLCAGVDLAVSPDFRRMTVLEVNAFGDRLEGVTWRGADAYTWQVRASLGRDWPPPAD